VSSVAERPNREALRRIADAARAGTSRLDLTDLGLTAVPEQIRQLSALTSLDLSGNRLTAVPEQIGRLTALTDLSVSRNRLTAVPEWIGRLTALTRLSLSGNRHLPSPLREVLAQGTEAVLAFLQALAESPVERWRSKALIVGEATVGKTSLAKQLLGEALDGARAMPVSTNSRASLPSPTSVQPFTVRHPGRVLALRCLADSPHPLVLYMSILPTPGGWIETLRVGFWLLLLGPPTQIPGHYRGSGHDQAERARSAALASRGRSVLRSLFRRLGRGGGVLRQAFVVDAAGEVAEAGFGVEGGVGGQVVLVEFPVEGRHGGVGGPVLGS
jgi:hypothetical protein